MKKLLALLLCVMMLVPMAAMADDGRIHITYSFWGNQTEAESVQKALDEFNAMQDKIFVSVRFSHRPLYPFLRIKHFSFVASGSLNLSQFLPKSRRKSPKLT